ncbi:CaiB/BaiF CoA transferase family protein [Leucothrix pacifica]|uniref:CoA transferase n=1 Tax=Leucothrix pacifica TaxID=1247513 RepID=A0A317CF81_9GAMM|nr:CaiB/BaiF CoA-transferase family protein [Leucothrix pacifica]PWQ96063.1 CoA transferase [Leucothrix pacifica]
MSDVNNQAMAPLSGLKVIDMSRILAGPWAGQVLADLGADVIKIERPKVGDDTRHWGPPYLKDRDGNDTRDAAYFFSANRGKQSVCIDITEAEGQAQIRELIASADVLIENYKVGGLAKYGLDYESLKAVNPALVYCSITGFGQTGPYAQRAGYDFMIQAMGGLMSITGEPDSVGGQPTKVGVAVTDIFTGLYSVIGIQAALHERQRTGLGKHVDMALFDCSAAILANQASNYLIGGVVPGRMGNAHPNIVPYQNFESADGHLIIAVGNDGQFANLCGVLGKPELAENPDYRTNASRVKNREVLCPLLQTELLSRTTAQWLETFEAVNVPCGPINTVDQVFNDPQILARDMVQTVEHPVGGEIKLAASPIRFVGEGKAEVGAPPVLRC